jgi:hypothetical protein
MAMEQRHDYNRSPNWQLGVFDWRWRNKRPHSYYIDTENVRHDYDINTDPCTYLVELGRCGWRRRTTGFLSAKSDVGRRLLL